MKLREISTPEIATVYGHTLNTVGQLIRRDGFPPPLRRSRPYSFNADEVKKWFLDYRMKCAMDNEPLDPSESLLVKEVISACENAIRQAVAEPSRAIGLAKGFGAALTSLQLIQSEVAKGCSGASVIAGNAGALTRSALSEFLSVASQSDDALAAVSDVAPQQRAAAPSSSAENAGSIGLDNLL